MSVCRCGHGPAGHRYRGGAMRGCRTRMCACLAWRPGPAATGDVCEPCGTRSARLRHLAQGRTCQACGVGYEPLPTAGEAA